MVKAVIDSNILVDYLRGVPQAETELALYDDPSISLITWIEILAGADAATERAAREFLQQFTLLPIDERVAEQAARIRRMRRIKLPDAIIGATAQAHGCLLVTRNSRDFDPADPGVRMPYRI
jgi:predicted nucleic acid-binding protein